MTTFKQGKSITLPISPPVDDLNAIQCSIVYRDNGIPMFVRIVRLAKVLKDIVVVPLSADISEEVYPADRYTKGGLQLRGGLMYGEIESRGGPAWDQVVAFAVAHKTGIATTGIIEPMLAEDIRDLTD